VKFELGIGPDSWGVWFPSDPLQPPFEQFLQEASKAGYRTVELGPYGYMPTNARELLPILDRSMLRVSAGFVFGDLHSPDSWEQRKPEVDSVCTLLQQVGAEFCLLTEAMYTDLRTGVQVAPSELNHEEISMLVENSNRIGAYIAERFGLRAAFHPHAQTPIEFEDQIELYLQMTDPTAVGLCLDTGHHAYCGGDPVAFLRRHHERIPYLHIKSVSQAVITEVAQRSLSFAEAVQLGAFTEPKAGNVDFLGFRDALRDVNYQGMGIVEQDCYPVAADKPYPIAVSTREYMSGLGLA